MIRGAIYAVTDMGLAMQSIMQGCKVLYVGELNPNIPQGFIECSVLLPPYEAVSAEIDGNMDMYESIYGSYLTFSDACFGMFATILVALNKGVNITMYVENGDELSHLNYLLRYFEGTYGLIVGTATRQFSYDERFNSQTAAILYSYMDGFIDETEFMINQSDINMLITLDQSHPFIKPIEKIVRKFNLQAVPDIVSWLNAYRNMVVLYGKYGQIIPGNIITIEKEG